MYKGIMQTKTLTLLFFGLILMGCGGSTGAITAAPVVAASSALSFAANKTFRFTWSDVSDATYYQLMENPDGNSGFTQVGSNIAQGNGVTNHIVPLHARVSAQYILKSCNRFGCTNALTLSVSGTMTNSIAYLKASNTGSDDRFFGDVLDLSSDGNTLAVGAPQEDSSLTGVNSIETDTGAEDSGAVYVFTKNNNVWQQDAYIKASNTGNFDYFGSSISLSGDGKTLVVGAPKEDGTADNSGAVYVFTHDGTDWSEQDYLKSNYIVEDDHFGGAGALDVSDDGSIIAIGAIGEDSNQVGTSNIINNDFKLALGAGAAYIFTRTGSNWAQTAYIKASNSGAGDNFGTLSLSGGGSTLVVGAPGEDDTASNSGAVYVFVYNGTKWLEKVRIKASNADPEDLFGGQQSIVISKDGLTFAVSAEGEDSDALGINGNDGNDGTNTSAVYVFRTQGADSDWIEEAYIKSDHDNENLFGGKASLALDKTGTRLAIGSVFNSSSSLGVSSNSNNIGSLTQAGAVYFYTKSGSSWAKTSFLKAPNTGSSDHFGVSVAIDETGATMVVGAAKESSNATGVAGTGQANNGASDSGAVYVY